MRRALLLWTGWTGVAAVVVYVAATAGGSLLDGSYSQLADHVSDLTATGAPTRLALAPAYLVYNGLVAAFAIALYLTSDRGRLFQAGTGLLIANAFAGVMMVTFFTEDLGGAPATVAGQGHVAFAALSSLAIVAASVVYGVAFRGPRLWRPLSAYSFLTAIAFVLIAPLAVIATAADVYAGLAERAAIAPFLSWLVVVGGYALLQAPHHRRRRPAEPAAHAPGSVVVRLMGVERIRHGEPPR